MSKQSYEEACRCGKGAPEPPDETAEESMRRRFGEGYQRTGIGLIRSRVKINNEERISEKSTPKSSKYQGPSGKPGPPGKTGLATSKPSAAGKPNQTICLCGSWGSNGNRGSNGRRL